MCVYNLGKFQSACFNLILNKLKIKILQALFCCCCFCYYFAKRKREWAIEINMQIFFSIYILRSTIFILETVSNRREKKIKKLQLDFFFFFKIPYIHNFFYFHSLIFCFCFYFLLYFLFLKELMMKHLFISSYYIIFINYIFIWNHLIMQVVYQEKNNNNNHRQRKFTLFVILYCFPLEIRKYILR